VSIIKPNLYVNDILGHRILGRDPFLVTPSVTFYLRQFDVKNRLPYFIKEVYNQEWLHSSLGYRSTVEFEELFMKTQNLCPTALTGIV
jgi:hypothetical protein